MENHNHEHNHTHSHEAVASPEETLALLEYMTGHNEHHAEELHRIAHSVPENAAELIHAAVSFMNSGNEKLREALKIMKGE